MNSKKEILKNSKEKSKGKAVPRLTAEKNATTCETPSAKPEQTAESRRKSRIPHSGVFFAVKTQKVVDLKKESRNKQVDAGSGLTKNNDSRRANKEEETTLTSIENLEISTVPAMMLCNDCQDVCKCSKSIALLQAICSPEQPTKSKLHEAGKDARKSRSIIIPSNSDTTRKTAKDAGKEKKAQSTRQPVRSEPKLQNKRLSTLRPPSDYKHKPTISSETHHDDVVPQSATVLTPQPAGISATGFVSDTESTIEPEEASVSEVLSSSESTQSDAEKLVSSNELSDVNESLPCSAFNLENVVDSQPSSNPTFWPPSVPTYEIITTLEPLAAHTPDSLMPKSELWRATHVVPSGLYESKSSKTNKVQDKCVSSSRVSRIPKIQTNLAKDTKVSQKICGNPSSSKLQNNLKQPAVKYYSSDNRAAAAKTISDIIEKKQIKSNEKKEVSQKKIFK